jgi:hypothetical protein
LFFELKFGIAGRNLEAAHSKSDTKSKLTQIQNLIPNQISMSLLLDLGSGF